MENKYYTPNIEDFHVGYECEIRQADKWEFYRVPYNECLSDLQGDGYRTPYLTQDQLINKEWRTWNGAGAFEKTNPKFFFSKREENLFNKKGFILINAMYDFSNHDLVIDKEQERIFIGKCKSINEFRQIIKFLNIK